MFDTACGVVTAAAASPGVEPMSRLKLNGAPNHGGSSGPTPGLRFTDPLRTLLCWASLLYSEGALDSRFMRLAGVNAGELQMVATECPDDLQVLRELRLAGVLFGRTNLALMLRARLAEMLMGATRSNDLLNVVKAVERCPGWVFGDENAASGKDEPGPTSQPGAACKATTVHEQQLHGTEEEDEASEEELARLIFGEDAPNEQQLGLLRQFASQFRQVALREIDSDDIDGEKLLKLTQTLAVMDAIDAAALTGESIRKAKLRKAKQARRI